MPILGEIFLNSGLGIVGFFGGRFWEKRDHRSQIINEKVTKLVGDISRLSDAASKYYIHQMDERTTAAETVLIGSAFKRINVELHSLCQITKLETVFFLDVVTTFHQAITSEPFGEIKISPVNANDPKILGIQYAEEAFIRKLKLIEKT